MLLSITLQKVRVEPITLKLKLYGDYSADNINIAQYSNAMQFSNDDIVSSK